jgi:uncharacterized LabA/DUF88 family protein
MDWPLLRDYLSRDRVIIETVVYMGTPPDVPEWEQRRRSHAGFMHYLRSQGFLVVTRNGIPAGESGFKANVDVLMAVDVMEMVIDVRPDTVVLVTGDSDFEFVAYKLRRRGIWVDVASTPQLVSQALKVSANNFIDLSDLISTFEARDYADHRGSDTSYPGP